MRKTLNKIVKEHGFELESYHRGCYTTYTLKKDMTGTDFPQDCKIFTVDVTKNKNNSFVFFTANHDFNNPTSYKKGVNWNNEFTLVKPDETEYVNLSVEEIEQLIIANS